MNLRRFLSIPIFIIVGLSLAAAIYLLSNRTKTPPAASSTPTVSSVPSAEPTTASPTFQTPPPPTEKQKTPSNKSVLTGKSDLFGTMLAFNVNDGLMGPGAFDELQKGWSVFKNDPQAMERYLNSLQQLYETRGELVKKTNFSSDREMAALFTWNVIEPEKGSFNWELTDMAVQSAKNAGVKFSAVIQPYAAWDQKNIQPIPGCQMLDSAWYDYRVGPVIKDVPEYENFLTKMVARYKGNVADWEIGNEPDAQCSGFRNDPADYLKLLQISYETIKKTDPAAKVLNGGASGFSDNSEERNFWTTFLRLGGGNYFDVFNLHYNKERNGAANDPSPFLGVLNFYNNLLADAGLKKPLWLTEFGTYSGTPQMPPGQSPGGPISNPPTQSQEFQAAWYFRYSILAFANNIERIFIDFAGSDNQNVGGSAIYNLQSRSRPFLKTLHAIDSEISGFNKIEKISEGQYEFTVGGKNVYAFWSGSLPAEITGQVKVIDMYGEQKSMSAQEIKFSGQEPVFVETQP